MKRIKAACADKTRGSSKSCIASWRWGSGMFLLAALPSYNANSADAPDSDTAVLQEITVTAEKREQSINDVGLSIVAISGDELSKRDVVNPADLVKVVPGFTFAETTNGTPVYTLRGVGFYESSLAASPTVSLYVDEQPLPFPVMTKGAILDLERVEVLKGPQGTLFGQNSTGGAINLIAAKPTDHLSYGAGVEYGRFNEIESNAFVSGPLTETLTARAAIATSQRLDGWQQSLTRDASLGKENMTRARVLLHWKPTDRLSMDLDVNGWQDKSETQAAQSIGLDPQAPTNITPALLAAPVARDNDRSADWGPDTHPVRDESFVQTSLRAGFDVTDSFRITALGAYNRYTNRAFNDSDGVSLYDQDRSPHGGITSYTAELRGSGKAGPVTYITGVNYESDTVREFFRTYTKDASSATPYGPDLVIDTPGVKSYTTAKTYAAFGNLTYDISDQFALDGGVRYTDNRRSFSGCAMDAGNGSLAAIFTLLENALAPAGSPPATPIGLYQCITLNNAGKAALVTDQLDEHNVSWRAGATYKPAVSTLIYATISQGYKNGGFPALPGSASAEFLPVTQEKLLSYEAGFKSRLADGRVQFNGSVFHYDYKNKQLLGKYVDPIFGALEALQNIPKSRVNGVELELTARPISHLQASASFTYLNAKITEFTGIDGLGSEPRNLAGTEFPNTPKYSAVTDLEYSAHASGSSDWFVGGDVTYNSATYGGIGNLEPLRIDPYALLDLRAGLRSSDNRWSVMLYGRNVTNKYYWTTALRVQDELVRFAGMPATFGIGFKYFVK